MKRQAGYGGFPAVLLTFSLLLLVLAVGFAVGRLVVARAYLDRAPKFDLQAAQAPDVSDEGPGERSALPGRVYVPPPVPPERPAEEGEGLVVVEPAEEAEGGPVASGQPLSPQPQPSQSETSATRSVRPAPVEPARKPEPGPTVAQPPPKRPEPAPAPAERVYTIQVGVFASLQGARQVVDELARSGHQARIAPDKKGGQELYRVLTGRYSDEYAARKAVEQLRSEGFEAFLVQQ